MTTFDDQASDHEEWHRALALREARERTTPDYERLICEECDYAKETSGRQCSAWRECLEDYEKRTKG